MRLQTCEPWLFVTATYHRDRDTEKFIWFTSVPQCLGLPAEASAKAGVPSQ